MNTELIKSARQLGNSNADIKRIYNAIQQDKTTIKSLINIKKKCHQTLKKQFIKHFKDEQQQTKKLKKQLKTGEIVDELDSGLQKEIYEDIKNKLTDEINTEIGKICFKEEKARLKEDKSRIKEEKKRECEEKKRERETKKALNKQNKTRKIIE